MSDGEVGDERLDLVEKEKERNNEETVMDKGRFYAAQGNGGEGERRNRRKGRR